MESKIVLIRHGITEGNIRGLYYGSTDVPLADKGKKKLATEREAGIFPDSETAQYFTSGMLRTEQTLQIIYGDKPHEAIEELRELDFGDFEMKTYEELHSVEEYQDWITAEDDSTPPPNGESIKDFTDRVKLGFKKLVAANELLMLKLRNEGKEAMTICICHGGVISGIMDYLWQGEKASFYDWIPEPGHGYILKVEDGTVVDRESF